MKFLDIPQSGKKGLDVSMGGRYGQVRRTLVIPTNPRTEAQLAVRRVFAQVAKAWRALTEAQRKAWNAAASTYQTRARLGQSGSLTGSQFHLKINALLGVLGIDPVVLPPGAPAFEVNPVGSLVITNAAGVVTLKVGCPSPPAANTLVWAAPPQSAGRSVCNDFRVLGVLPAPAQGSCDVTALYVARYGSPAPGTKVFLRVTQTQNGWEDIPVATDAVVPAGA